MPLKNTSTLFGIGQFAIDAEQLEVEARV